MPVANATASLINNGFDVLDNTKKKLFFLWPRFHITWYIIEATENRTRNHLESITVSGGWEPRTY